MLHTYLTVLVLGTIVLAAAGCGNSSNAGTSSANTPPVTVTAPAAAATTAPAHAITARVQIAPSAPLSRSRFIAKADAICGRLNSELDAVQVKKPSELGRVLPQEVAYERVEVSNLAKLVPPRSLHGDWQQILNASLQRAEDTAELAANSNANVPVTDLPLTQTMIAIHNHMLIIALRDGFKVCSHS